MIWEELGPSNDDWKKRWNNFKRWFFGAMTFGCDTYCYWWWWWWWCWQLTSVCFIGCWYDSMCLPFWLGTWKAFGSASLSYCFWCVTQSWNAACRDVMQSPSCFQCYVHVCICLPLLVSNHLHGVYIMYVYMTTCMTPCWCPCNVPIRCIW